MFCDPRRAGRFSNGTFGGKKVDLRGLTLSYKFFTLRKPLRVSVFHYVLSAWLYATCWTRRNKALRCDRDTPCSQGPSTDKRSLKLKTKIHYITSKNNKCTRRHRR